MRKASIFLSALLLICLYNVRPGSDLILIVLEKMSVLLNYYYYYY